jgi:peptidoglycan/xylan/chitin deacetylase (PgdA/CDA1 family)
MRYLLFHKSVARFSFSSTNFASNRLHRLLTWLQAEIGTASVGLTFDDGYEHYVDVLPPLIEQFSIRPLVFVPTGLIGKPAAWDYSYPVCRLNHLERRSIRKLANLGVEFGSHGHTHSDLTALGQRRLELELKQSRDVLSDLSGWRIDTISYPFGRWNQRVLETASEFGFDRGFTSGFPTAQDESMAIGRISIYGFDTRFSIEAKLGSGCLRELERYKAAVANRLSGGTRLLIRLRRAT